MSNDRDVPAARDGNPPRYTVPAEPRLPAPAPDLAEVTRLVLEAAVPQFADAAAVFVLEQLLSGGGPAGQEASSDVVMRRLGTRFAQAGRLAADAAFPPGEVIALAADSAQARCMYDGSPVIFSQPHGTTPERANPGAGVIQARYTSFLVAPVTAHGAAAGFLLLARAQGAPAFRGGDAAAAAGLADHAGTGIASHLNRVREQSATGTLPPRRPAASRHAAPGLEIAGRCLPAAGHQTGGDWYDIIHLPAGRTGLIVGDVMGHGPQAAAIMARLSTAAYALADLDLAPAQILRQLNRTALTLPNSTLATCAYAVIDPGSQSCTIATAGHLPPVLAMPDGTTRIPGIPGGQSLGVGTASYGQARIRLLPGTILALYTDGLVETRTRPFDQGILALRSVLACSHPHLDDACDQLIKTLGAAREDDTTVVLARIPGPHSAPAPARPK